MFVRIKKKDKGRFSIQIVENHRRGNKVLQKIVRHIGVAQNEGEIHELRKLADSIIIEEKEKRQPVLPFFRPEEIYAPRKDNTPDEHVNISKLREDQRIIDGIRDIFGKLFDDLGYNKIIRRTNQNKQWNAILKACVLARLANPTSKRRTASLLEEDYAIRIPLDRIYRMMDHVYENEEEGRRVVAQTTLNLFREKVDVLFFDVTTLYFESIEKDELKDFGFSKDNKFNEVQVVFALVTTTDGLPITYKLFPGNTYEGHTLIEIIRELKKEYDVNDVTLVADRAMFNKSNLTLLESEQVGIKYIVAAALKKLNKKYKQQIIESHDYSPTEVDGSLHWVKEWDYEGKRLIVSYSNKRAQKDAACRHRMIERLMKKLGSGKCKIKDLIPNYGTKKYITVNNAEATLNEDKIAEDESWDGLHGVITNIPNQDARRILARYKELWQIEEAFRINKHDLRLRPIYHWTPKRISAHVMICFIAYALSKQALHRLRIQQRESISFERLRNELLHVQSSILLDIETKKKYILPSKVTKIQRKIYQTFGLKRSEVPMRI